MNTIIMGVDPGYMKTGYALIQVYLDDQDITRYRLIICGNICLAKLACSKKLLKIQKTLIALIKTYGSDVGMVEDVFMAHNPQTIIKMGKVLGVIQCTLSKYMPIYSYSPLSIRKIVTGSGKSSKIESLVRVREILDPTSVVIPGLDASDAIAIALAYALQAPDQSD